MTTIQIDGQTITSTVNQSSTWAKVYGRPVSVIRRTLAHAINEPARNLECLTEAYAKTNTELTQEHIDYVLADAVQRATKAEKELAKIADLADDFIVWEKAGYNKTREAAEKAKPHNGTPNGTVFRVVKVSDVMVD